MSKNWEAVGRSKRKSQEKYSNKVYIRHVRVYRRWRLQNKKEGYGCIYSLRIFIAASLILYELSQLGAYSCFIQSMCFLTSLK